METKKKKPEEQEPGTSVISRERQTLSYDKEDLTAIAVSTFEENLHNAIDYQTNRKKETVKKIESLGDDIIKEHDDLMRDLGASLAREKIDPIAKAIGIPSKSLQVTVTHATGINKSAFVQKGFSFLQPSKGDFKDQSCYAYRILSGETSIHVDISGDIKVKDVPGAEKILRKAVALHPEWEDLMAISVKCSEAIVDAKKELSQIDRVERQAKAAMARISFKDNEKGRQYIDALGELPIFKKAKALGAPEAPAKNKK